MIIKSISRDDVPNYKLDRAIEKFKVVQAEALEQIKIAISNIADMDYLCEIKEHVDKAILHFEEIDTMELLDDEDDEDEED